MKNDESRPTDNGGAAPTNPPRFTSDSTPAGMSAVALAIGGGGVR